MRKLLRFFHHNALFLISIFLIAFIPLLPKRPLVDIVGTWVDIRLEDFVVVFSYVVLGIILLKTKDRFKTPLTIPIIVYWIVGLLSLLNSLLFIGHRLPGFFPQVAALFYLRGIEYMGLFFVGFWAIKRVEHRLKWIVIILSLTVFTVFVYGVGQKYYGWPAFSTMNEEFAKGIPLRLPPTARVMSTFAGHYDLAAYLVLVIPLLGSIIFSLKHRAYQVLLFVVTVCAFILLLFTASRISFGVYLVAISLMLWWRKKKILIIPVVVASIISVNFVTGATERFLKTLRFDDVIVDLSTGKPIGSVAKLEGDAVTLEPIAAPDEENLPKGSGFISVPVTLTSTITSTSSSSIQRVEIIKKKNLATGSGEIATVSGSFLIQKAFVLDISITTRFQGQWPRAIEAFSRNVFLGSGFSTLSLAADGNYHRLLGETGLLGTISFLGILIYSFYAFFKLRDKLEGLELGFFVGLFAGIAGLLLNAVLIDVFQASKVAFTLWLLLGFAMAILSRYQLDLSYVSVLRRFFFNPLAYTVYLFAFVFFVYQRSVPQYFIGDDFTWLRWAAEAKFDDIPSFFTDSSGFFYRPIPKIWYFLLFSVFWLLPQPYHIASILLFGLSALFLASLLSFFGVQRMLRIFLIAFYIVMSVHHESVFWISNHSHLLGYVFLLGSLLCFLFFWSGLKKGKIWYVSGVSLLFLSMFSYDIMVVAPVIVLLFGGFGYRKWRSSMPLLVMIPLYLFLRSSANAVPPSGDYGYNLARFIPNSIANFIAYIGGILLGPRVIEEIASIRGAMRSYASIITFGGFISISFVSFIVWKYKTVILKERWVLVLLGSFLLTLSMYLGLGGATDRYTLYASGLFILLGGVLLHRVWSNFSFILKGATVFIVLLSSLWNYSELRRLEEQWTFAASVTQRTLQTMRQHYFPLLEHKTFVYVNTPIRYGNAWIFPTGLADALWHMYRESPFDIVQVNSVEEAFAYPHKKDSAKIVFEFDQAYNLQQVVKE